MNKMANLIKFWTLSLLVVTGFVFASQPPKAGPMTESYYPNLRLCLGNNILNDPSGKLCPTLKSDPVDPKYRGFLMEALKRLNHPYPHYVVIQKEPKTKNASAGPMHVCSKDQEIGQSVIINNKEEIIRGVCIDEEYWNTLAYGAQRLVIFHEATHLTNKHYYRNSADLKISRELEREADTLGAQTAKCKHCTWDNACDRLDRYNNMLKFHGYATVNWEYIRKLNLNEAMANARAYSETANS